MYQLRKCTDEYKKLVISILLSLPDIVILIIPSLLFFSFLLIF